MTDPADSFEARAERVDQEDAPAPLQFLSMKELRARVDAAGPRRFLLRGYWPAGDYGVHAGDAKAQKSWNTVDAMVSIAAGQPWLGAIPVDLDGPVLWFAGEGGEADLLRRIDAVCASRGIIADDLPIIICARVPHLSNAVHLGLMAEQLDKLRPVMSALDPLYLAARGAKGSDLYAMGGMLETAQHLCQAAASGLWLVHHQNRKEGRGAGRISGAGPAEWGRVLISATVVGRRVDPETQETTVITELDALGGSIPGGRLRLVRRICADDPADLNSPLRYSVEAAEVEDSGEDAEGQERFRPAVKKILAVLTEAVGPLSVQTIGDAVASKFGHGLTRPTISKGCADLVSRGLVDELDQGPYGTKFWQVVQK